VNRRFSRITLLVANNQLCWFNTFILFVLYRLSNRSKLINFLYIQCCCMTWWQTCDYNKLPTSTKFLHSRSNTTKRGPSPHRSQFSGFESITIVGCIALYLSCLAQRWVCRARYSQYRLLYHSNFPNTTFFCNNFASSCNRSPVQTGTLKKTCLYSEPTSNRRTIFWFFYHGFKTQAIPALEHDSIIKTQGMTGWIWTAINEWFIRWWISYTL